MVEVYDYNVNNFAKNDSDLKYGFEFGTRFNFLKWMIREIVF